MTAQPTLIKAMLTILLPLSSNFCFAEVVVAYSDFPPLAYTVNGEPAGFSISLFRKCADVLELEFRFVEKTFSEKLEGIISGEIDVAIGGISITSEREAKCDFSTPTLTGGLCCISNAEPSFVPTFSSRATRLLAALALFLLAFGHVLWFFERGQNAIDDKYFPGIFESFWCLFATMSTVGYGDIAPRRWAGRVISVFVMLLGISFFGIITASFTTDFLAEARTQSVVDLKSLADVVVGCKRGTIAEGLLSREGIRHSSVDSFVDLVEGLRNSDFQVVVHDEILSRYAIGDDPTLNVESLRSARQQYAFAVPEQSPFLEKLNRALLELKETGMYDLIKKAWPDLPE